MSPSRMMGREAMAVENITDEQVDSWREDGVVHLSGAFAPQWIDLLTEGIERAMAEPGPLAKDYAAPGAGSFFTDHAMFRRIEALRRFLFDSPAARIAARLMAAHRINLFDDHLLVKEPGTENPTHWHQDTPYYQVAGEQICSLWIPIDAVSRDTGAMRFVKGSHRWGKLFRPIRIGLGEAVAQADQLDGPAPDIDAEPERYDTVEFDCSPGDCIAFHGATLHGAAPNMSAHTRRRALSLRFAGDDVTWRRRSYLPSQEDIPELTEGGPIDCAEYPRVWTA